MRAINATVMRQNNRTILLNRIRMRPISRAELADETGLTRASVTQIVEELIDKSLVIETSRVERSHLGRRSTQLAINPHSGCVFAVNLRANECTVGATDMLGNVLLRSIEVVAGREPRDVLDSVAVLLDQQRRELGLAANQVYGLGVSVPGPVNLQTGSAYNLVGMPEWNYLPICRELESRTGMDVYIESAADALALEQQYFGDASDHFVLVDLGNAVSTGVVIDGVLYRGAPDFAMELGQCFADAQSGCTLNHLLAENGCVNWQSMLEDPDSDAHLPQLLHLSHHLANMMCIYRVKHLALGGDIGGKLQALLPRLTDCVKQLLPAPFRNSAQLSIAVSDPVRMSAAAAYHHIFSL